jgi:hypothetical protein
MSYYLFTIEEEVQRPLPYNTKLFKYEPVESKKYFVIKIENNTVQILDDKEQVLTHGTLSTREDNALDLNQPIKFSLGIDKITFAGGLLTIKDNTCELIICGSGLPYISASRGTLRKLIKKNITNK